MDSFDTWLEALEKRHLADLRPPEVHRAVRALSDDYVHRRHRVADDALAGRGKRAAFALYFGPLHFLVVRNVARELGVPSTHLPRVLDLGCGTGAGGAAVASLMVQPVVVTGIDRLGWTLEEAAFTYRHFNLRHRVQRGDVGRPRVRIEPRALVVAAYTVNELDAETRASLLEWFCSNLEPSSGLLIVEPISKAVTPWWSEWSAALQALGGQERQWLFDEPLPQRLRQMDRAAGLNHQVRKARTLWIAPRD
ncbi:MAG: methyltransferase domain-containing protein [Acidobacteriota bacterium]